MAFRILEWWPYIKVGISRVLHVVEEDSGTTGGIRRLSVSDPSRFEVTRESERSVSVNDMRIQLDLAFGNVRKKKQKTMEMQRHRKELVTEKRKGIRDFLLVASRCLHN